MSVSSLEKKFIQLQCQEPEYTFEEIQYLINQEEENMTEAEIQAYLENTKEKAKIQKAINKKKASRKSDALINDMHVLISKLKKIINDIDDEDPGLNKNKINAIKEVRQTIMNIATLAGELKKQQDVNISHYYMPINKLEDWFQQRLKKLKNSQKF